MPAVSDNIELSSSLSSLSVQEEEYIRLLGFPRGWVLEGRTRELADWAREWYAQHGRPWMYARQAERVEIAGDLIFINGVRFSSRRLRATLADAEAHGVILVAVGAGPEAEEEARRRWVDEKPDEYFFLEVYASAVVEHLTTLAGARLCDWAEQRQMAVLPHYSPGYPEWDVAEQPRLLELLKKTRIESFPSRVDAFESGMLRPKKTQLAAFGLTRHADRLQRLTSLVPCERCSFGPCQYRRAPYRRPRVSLPSRRNSRCRRSTAMRDMEPTGRRWSDGPGNGLPCAQNRTDLWMRSSATTEPLAPIWGVRLRSFIA